MVSDSTPQHHYSEKHTKIESLKRLPLVEKTHTTTR